MTKTRSLVSGTPRERLQPHQLELLIELVASESGMARSIRPSCDARRCTKNARETPRQHGKADPAPTPIRPRTKLLTEPDTSSCLMSAGLPLDAAMLLH